MAVRLVVFDLDDTLYLERDYVRSGFTAVGRVLLRDYGVAGFQEEAWAAFLRGRRGDIFDATLLALLGTVSRPLVQRCVEVYRTHAPDIALLPDASALLTWCGGRFSTAVVTDGPASSQRAKVRALDLMSRVDRVVVTDEMGSGWAKPSARSFQLLQDQFGCCGRECVYIADNPVKDFAGPAELDWQTVRIRRRGGLHESVRSELDAQWVLTSMGREALVPLEPMFGASPR